MKKRTQQMGLIIAGLLVVLAAYCPRVVGWRALREHSHRN
jgi:hypothetical protein